MISVALKMRCAGVTVGRHHQHRGRLHQHRLAGVRIEDVGKQLLGGVHVGPVDQFVGELVDPVAVRGHARARGAVGVVGRALPGVVVGRADQQVQQPLFLVQPQHLAHLGGALEDQVRAVEEDASFVTGTMNPRLVVCGVSI